LPSTLRQGRLFSGTNQGFLDFPETSLSDFHEQVVLAPKMLVKATVRQ
jgi:hypothetical protein